MYAALVSVVFGSVKKHGEDSSLSTCSLTTIDAHHCGLPRDSASSSCAHELASNDQRRPCITKTGNGYSTFSRTGGRAFTPNILTHDNM